MITLSLSPRVQSSLRLLPDYCLHHLKKLIMNKHNSKMCQKKIEKNTNIKKTLPRQSYRWVRFLCPSIPVKKNTINSLTQNIIA